MKISFTEIGLTCICQLAHFLHDSISENVMHRIIIITGSPSQNHEDNFLQVPYFSYCFKIFNIILHGKLNFTANLFFNIRIFNLYLTKPILFCLTDTEHCSKSCPSQVFLYFNVCTYNVISKINAKNAN